MNRQLIPQVLLAAAIASLLWGSVLLLYGGFDFALAGVRIRSNNSTRPLVLGVMLAVWFALVFDDGRGGRVSSVVLRFTAWMGARLQLIAIFLALSAVVVGVHLGSKAAGGSDSYGYISQAELWLNGELQVEQPWVVRAPWPNSEWTFSPLGYKPGTRPTTLTPTYSAGLPILMAVAKKVAGHCAVFWVVPISAGIFILTTFFLCRRIADAYVAAAAAWLLATSPAFIFMLLAPMSDIPAAAAWTVTIYGVTRGTFASALCGGLAAALAILIRPNLAPLAGVAAVWYFIQAWSDRSTFRVRLAQAAAFTSALAPAVAITAALNHYRSGSALISGYGAVGDIFSAQNLVPNAGAYAAWLSQTQTPIVFLGIAILFLPRKPFWNANAPAATVLVLGLFVAVVIAEYCAYLTFGSWGDLRFLLPSFGFMMIGTAVVLLSLTRTAYTRTNPRYHRLATLVAFIAVFALGLHGLKFARQEAVFQQQVSETKYPVAANFVAARTGERAVILAGQHNGSIRYYAGRLTLSYFSLEPAWLDRAVAWLDEQGAHPYALLEEFEVRDFRNHFGRNSRLGNLSMTPIVSYEGPTKIYLFDLMRDPTDRGTERVVDPSPSLECFPPASDTTPPLR